MSEGNGGNNRPRPNPRPPSYSDKYDTLKYRLAQLESHRASLAEDNARLRSELASLNTRINQASLSANSNASINLSAEQLSAHPQLPMRLVQTVMTSTPIHADGSGGARLARAHHDWVVRGSKAEPQEFSPQRVVLVVDDLGNTPQGQPIDEVVIPLLTDILNSSRLFRQTEGLASSSAFTLEINRVNDFIHLRLFRPGPEKKRLLCVVKIAVIPGLMSDSNSLRNTLAHGVDSFSPRLWADWIR